MKGIVSGMHPHLAALVENVSLTGTVQTDMIALLEHYGRVGIIEHNKRVAAEAKRLAHHWQEDDTSAEIAGLLHDISAIIPADQRIPLAESLGLDILPQERVAPIILHQRLSAVIAQQVFAITSVPILSAIGCHTTLKANASTLDKIVFVADKIKWDFSSDPPYLAELTVAAEQSLDQAAYCYLSYLWQKRDELPAIHPWLVQAYQELSCQMRQEAEWSSGPSKQS
jgi:predicted HD superfamily hydrolase involved in NAD metabolism